jgi:hypothetical protein
VVDATLDVLRRQIRELQKQVDELNGRRDRGNEQPSGDQPRRDGRQGLNERQGTGELPSPARRAFGDNQHDRQQPNGDQADDKKADDKKADDKKADDKKADDKKPDDKKPDDKKPDDKADDDKADDDKADDDKADDDKADDRDLSAIETESDHAAALAMTIGASSINSALGSLVAAPQRGALNTNVTDWRQRMRNYGYNSRNPYLNNPYYNRFGPYYFRSPYYGNSYYRYGGRPYYYAPRTSGLNYSRGLRMSPGFGGFWY